MSSGYTNSAAARVIDWANGNTTTAPTPPFKLHVETTAGSAAAAGTDLGSTTFPTIAMAAATGAPSAAPSALSSGAASVTAGAAGVLSAVAIYDSAGTPFRWLFGAMTASRTVAIADTVAFAAGAVSNAIAST